MVLGARKAKEDKNLDQLLTGLSHQPNFVDHRFVYVNHFTINICRRWNRTIDDRINLIGSAERT